MEYIIDSRKHGRTTILFDPEDFDLLSQHKWTISKDSKTFYAATSIQHGNKRKTLLMHRLLLNPSKDQKVDHKDCNGLNNQRSNIRIASNSQNSWNKRMQPNNTTGYKGVFLFRKNKYRVQIYVFGKCINGGKIFNDPTEAAKRYNELAIQHHGDFANLNIF